MIVYTPLWKTMKEKGVSSYALIYKHQIASNTVQRLRNNMPCTTTTLNDLCRILDCGISDIIAYIPDDKVTPPEE